MSNSNQQMINFASSSSSSSSSSPSSSSSSSKRHDVFLSFRGEDTRNNFTSHLYDALIQKKVETFNIDYYRLEKGDEISPAALITAIEESHVSVVIFSQNYASSKWCLDEIAKIVECKKDQGQVVIPVFYKTDPSHVRKQRGTYEEAFAKHEQDLKNNNSHKVHKWRAALTEAANLSGWDFHTYRTESEFIKDIVKDILQKLNIIYPIELKGLVGIEENYVGAESLLEIGSREVRMIGIWGMGGIGKTTLAIALHVKLYSQFESHCFLASVREQSEKYGLDVLRNKLFSELLGEKNLHVDVPKFESHFVTSRLRRKRVLIVLDDVATSEQLEDLIIDYDCLGPGSRVIVTTRDKHIFSHVDGIHEVKELDKHDSLQLFCLNAFREKHPRNGFEELSESVIAYCKGNPLALKVLGARLRSRSKETWKSDLRKLQKIPDVKIHNVLRLSCDDLDHTEKDIFLDIACFFKGESRDRVTSVLEACDFFAAIGIEVLLDKSLITISNEDKIEMHDLIQEMGWNIVHQESMKDPGRRSRLWDPKEVSDVLRYNRGTEAIEGIVLSVSKIEDLHLISNSFARMTNIRILKFYNEMWSERCNLYLPNGLVSLPDKLRYLEWHGYCLGSLPSTFSAKLLVELCMPYSNLEKLWDGVQNLGNLKQMDLGFCTHLVEVPDLCMATSLEKLSLVRCNSLRQVHPSILSLHKLEILDLEGCTELESLQTGNRLKSLRNLRLSNCSSLREFSVSSEQLERLWLDGTDIQELPSSIWSCEKLKLFNLQDCDNLHGFGDDTSSTTNYDDPGIGSLGILILSGCKQLNASNLCFSLDALRCVTVLALENCCNLQVLPDSIASLSSLKHLQLSGSNVERLSPNITNLLKLIELTLDNCRKLVALPHQLPPSLRVLSAVNCTSLETDLIQLDAPFELEHVPLEPPQSVFLPGAQVPEWFSFCSRDQASVVTIPHLPKPGLRGYIFCLVLSQNTAYEYVECSIYKYSRRIGSTGKSLESPNLVSDHVFIWYDEDVIGRGRDISSHGGIQKSGGASDNLYGISFEFLLRDEDGNRSTKGIKGCGVCPLYVSEQKGKLELEFAGSSKDIELNTSKDMNELKPATIGFGINEGSNHDNEGYQTTQNENTSCQISTDYQCGEATSPFISFLLKGKRQPPYRVSTASDCKREPQSFKEEDCYASLIPKSQIITTCDTSRASNIDSNQSIEVSEEKDLTCNQIHECSEPVTPERSVHTLVEIDNPNLEPDWDPIAELESMLHSSYELYPTCTDHSTTVAALLENLETLLDTSLETISSDDEVKQQFHHVLEQLAQFEDQIPVRFHPVICKLKTFIEGVDVATFVSAQKTIQDYDQLLQSRSLLSNQLESAKARKELINSKVSQGKMQFEKINSEIMELEQKLKGLIETRDKLKRELDNCGVENSKLKTEVAKWVPECKSIVIALKKSDTSYKMALTNKKKAEDEWAHLKNSFHLSRQ